MPRDATVERVLLAARRLLGSSKGVQLTPFTREIDDLRFAMQTFDARAAEVERAVSTGDPPDGDVVLDVRASDLRPLSRSPDPLETACRDLLRALSRLRDVRLLPAPDADPRPLAELMGAARRALAEREAAAVVSRYEAALQKAIEDLRHLENADLERRIAENEDSFPLRKTALYRRIRALGPDFDEIVATADELREAWRYVRERSARDFYDPPRTTAVRLFNRTILRADPPDGRPWTVGEADDLLPEDVLSSFRRVNESETEEGEQ